MPCAERAVQAYNKPSHVLVPPSTADPQRSLLVADGPEQFFGVQDDKETIWHDAVPVAAVRNGFTENVFVWVWNRTDYNRQVAVTMANPSSTDITVRDVLQVSRTSRLAPSLNLIGKPLACALISRQPADYDSYDSVLVSAGQTEVIAGPWSWPGQDGQPANGYVRGAQVSYRLEGAVTPSVAPVVRVVYGPNGFDPTSVTDPPPDVSQHVPHPRGAWRYAEREYRLDLQLPMSAPRRWELASYRRRAWTAGESANSVATDNWGGFGGVWRVFLNITNHDPCGVAELFLRLYRGQPNPDSRDPFPKFVGAFRKGFAVGAGPPALGAPQISGVLAVQKNERAGSIVDEFTHLDFIRLPKLSRGVFRLEVAVVGGASCPFDLVAEQA